MPNSDRPTVKLLPKTDPRPIRRGAPWVFANQLVMDRRTRGIEPGALVNLAAPDGGVLGTFAFNPNSKIAARALDPEPDVEVTETWCRNRISQALRHRERLFEAPYYRLIHAEADGLPGLVIDRFGDAAVIQPNAAWAEAALDNLTAALATETGVTRIFKNAASRARGLEGLDAENTVLLGAFDGPLEVPMNGATYLADLTHGQKSGLFYDQRDNHAFAARLAQGARVLDVFTHVGGFALAALAAGAKSALAVDASAPALDLAQKGAEASGVGDRFETRQGDAFEVLAALEGEKFDMVVCDPPAFAPSKPALDAGLRAYERIARLATPLVEPGGYLILCSCSHAADLAKFRAACLRGIGRAGRRAQIVATGAASPDHPLHPALAESGYLKALFFRLIT